MKRTLEPEVMDTPEEADSYDAMDHSGPNEAFVARLLELVGPRGFPGGRILDIGTGPGHIPLLIVERLPGAHVVGIDLAENMLRHARAKQARSPHRARLEFRRADAKGLDFPAASFDAVLSNTILHHIPDPRPFLAEARRVLKPGGVLLIRDLYRPPTPERARELVLEHAADASPMQQELFQASLHAALEPDELRALARDAGLVDFEVTIDSDRHMSLQVRTGR